MLPAAALALILACAWRLACACLPGGAAVAHRLRHLGPKPLVNSCYLPRRRRQLMLHQPADVAKLSPFAKPAE